MNESEMQNVIAQTIFNKDPNAEAYLFGSRAKGNHKPDSDWDILILVDENELTNELDDKFRHDLYKLSLKSEQVISILIYPKKYWKEELKFSSLYDDVIKEGIKLKWKKHKFIS